MKHTLLGTLSMVFALSMSDCGIAAEKPKYVAVTVFRFRPTADHAIYDRVVAILRAKNIRLAGAGGAGGMTVSVLSDRATEARQLLAKAIKAEKLQVSLIGPTGVIVPLTAFSDRERTND